MSSQNLLFATDKVVKCKVVESGSDGTTIGFNATKILKPKKRKLLWKGTVKEMREHPFYRFAVNDILDMPDEDSEDVISFKNYIKEELL